MQINRSVMLLLMTLVLLSCVPIPMLVVERPSVVITVVDSKGEAIEGAEVNLITCLRYCETVVSKVSSITDHEGKAYFSSKHVLDAMLLPWRKRPNRYGWSFCVSKEGFNIDWSSIYHTPEVVENMRITLRPGESEVCPDKLINYRRLY